LFALTNDICNDKIAWRIGRHASGGPRLDAGDNARARDDQPNPDMPSHNASTFQPINQFPNQLTEV
jgi:hypothetical protein